MYLKIYPDSRLLFETNLGEICYYIHNNICDNK